MSRRYAVLDVFTDRPLAGNQLAVVLDSAGLGDARMQAIAAEFNLSETVFVFPAAKPVHSAAIRIFTPARELPFAGHPTVGTAVLLGLERAASGIGNGQMVLVLEEKVGPVRCGVTLRSDDLGHAIFDLPILPAEGAAPPDRDALAAALGLMPGEIGFENHQPTIFDAGVSYTFVPVRDLAAIGKAKANHSAWRAAFGQGGPAFLYCREVTESVRQLPRADVRAGAWHYRRSGDGKRGRGAGRSNREVRPAAGRWPSLRHRAGLRDGAAEPDRPRNRHGRGRGRSGEDRR